MLALVSAAFVVASAFMVAGFFFAINDFAALVGTFFLAVFAVGSSAGAILAVVLTNMLASFDCLNSSSINSFGVGVVASCHAECESGGDESG